MAPELRFDAEWEALGRGTAEDRACFAGLSITAGNLLFTDAQDYLLNRSRDRAYLSGYRLAEWLAWNWWRLRWEAGRTVDDWAQAHHLPSIGGGYIWPNVTISSDAETVAVGAKPTMRRPEEPIRYVADGTCNLDAGSFSDAVGLVIEQVLDRLQERGVTGSNLAAIWGDVTAERTVPEASRLRQLEARMGFDAPPDLLAELERSGKELGESSVAEIAADHARGDGLADGSLAGRLKATASAEGIPLDPDSTLRLDPTVLGELAGKPWERGAQLARPGPQPGVAGGGAHFHRTAGADGCRGAKGAGSRQSFGVRLRARSWRDRQSCGAAVGMGNETAVRRRTDAGRHDPAQGSRPPVSGN